MPWASSTARTSTSRRDVSPSLPPGFVSVRDILDERIRPGTLTNVCAIVKDCRLPMPTAGTDWKATMTLYDISTQDDSEGIPLSIFRAQNDIPDVNAADVLLMYNVKVQRWNFNPISLITNMRTIILVYSGAKIPRYPRSARIALQPPAGKAAVKEPSEVENKYVSYFYHEIDKGAVPDQEEFQLMATRSLNVKQKFCLLSDVIEHKFCDLIVRVCRDPFDHGERVTLYVSDYTENSSFFNYTWEGVQDMESGSGDVYGYTSRRQSDTTNKWVGPYGKKAMQVTCWEPHASVVREEVKAGDWVSLRNVQIRTGHDGANLEGYIREERNQPLTNKVNVAVLDLHDKDTIDSRLKDAIRRWRDYNKIKEKQVKTLKASEGNPKHKLVDPSESSENLNAEGRRKRKRAGAAKKIAEQEKRLKEEVLGLNPLVVCESADRPITQVASILEQPSYQTAIEGNPVQLALPFICANYSANVRVVDFHPQRLEDFARGRRRNAFDMLSDNSGSDASSSEEDSDDEDDNAGGDVAWEWRFALQLEDVSHKPNAPQRVWVIVNNREAECLTGLDATDLREDEDTLAALREKLFTLWGELEEKKHWQLGREEEARKRKPGAAPPPSRSDDEDDGRKGSAKHKTGAPAVSNKPFTCCIRQYGIRVRESDAALADAGKGYRWQRVFGLFGTKISS